MPAERLTMRKIREVFRLKFDCELSNRNKIAQSCHIARTTVGVYPSWPKYKGSGDVNSASSFTCSNY